MTKDQFNNAYERVYELRYSEVKSLAENRNLSNIERGLQAIFLLEREGISIDDWECWLAPYLFDK